MNIWQASKSTADNIAVAGYAAIALGTICGLAATLLSAAPLAIVSTAAIVCGTLSTFWAAGVRNLNSDRAIAEANASAELARLSALEAARDLERERQARLRMEQALQHRRLAAEAAKQLAERLRPFATADGVEGPLTAAVFAVSASLEANNLADQIASAFESAGFRINRNQVLYDEQYAVNGVGVLTSDVEEAKERGAALVSAIEEAGLAAFPLPVRRAHEPEKASSRRYNLSVSVAVGDRF